MATHFLAVNDLGSKTWEQLVQASLQFSLGKFKTFDKKQHVSSLFLEPSTRTSLSFSIAANNLNLAYHNIDAEHSSLSKGETLLDTLLNFEAMGISSTVVRLKTESELATCAKNLKNMSLICAGEGKTSHPSQALLDTCTIYEQFKKLDGLKILFLGDVEHSRVYSSNIAWMSWYDNQICFFSPSSKKIINCKNKEIYSDSLDQAIGDFDVIILLRPQLERHEEKLDLKNYHQSFGITDQRFKKIKPTAIIMHPGPFYRNLEIADELLSKPCVKIYRQVYWGVFARMSIYSHVLREKNE